VYRRLRSPLGTSSVPYNAARSYVWLPSAASGDIRMNRKEDTAHIYMGGNAGKTEIDAGLMHNPGKDNWSLFLKGGGSCKPAISMRFKSNQHVYLVFEVLANGKVGVGVDGYFMDGTYGTNWCIVSAYDWRYDGVNNRIKRVTSIAQKQNKYDPNSGSYIRGVEWNDVLIGSTSKTPDTIHSWGSKDTKVNCVYPSTAKVYVDFRAHDHEILTLDLR
ncbi:MAG: hypothetical protein ACRDFT_05545, partial [bacterium]